jgi:hypothetical protein
MRNDHYEGKTLADPELRALFSREAVLGSDWYRARLEAKQRVDERLWSRHVRHLERFLRNANYATEAERLGISSRLDHALEELRRVQAEDYVPSLVGTTGAEPAVREPTPM